MREDIKDKLKVGEPFYISVKSQGGQLSAMKIMPMMNGNIIRYTRLADNKGWGTRVVDDIFPADYLDTLDIVDILSNEDAAIETGNIKPEEY